MGSSREIVSMLVDTGSTCNLMPLSQWQRLCDRIQLAGQKLVGFNGQSTQSLGTVAIGTQIGGWTKSIVYQVAGENSQTILGYPGMKEFAFVVACSGDCFVKDGRARIICHDVEMHEEVDDVGVFAGQSLNLSVKLTRSGQKVGNLRIRQGRVLLSMSKPLVLSPYETRMVVLPFQLAGSGLQVVVGFNQVPNVLVSV